MAPTSAPPPELGCCTAIGWLQTWCGTATCWMTGVLEITRPTSSAKAGVPNEATMPIADNRTACFMTTP